MLAAETTCVRKSCAAFCLAHFVTAVTAMPVAVSFLIYGGCIAGVESAEPEGAMLDAETLSRHLGSVAGWISAGQLWFVCAAMPAYFHRIARTTGSHTLPIRAVLATQASCGRLGGAAFERAEFLQCVGSAEPF